MARYNAKDDSKRKKARPFRISDEDYQLIEEEIERLNQLTPGLNLNFSQFALIAMLEKVKKGKEST